MNRKLKLDELNRISIDEFKNTTKTPLIIVLENIRSLNNIGSVFRTGDAFKIEAIHLVGITAQPPHREINKTALGATESVYWKHYPTIDESIQEIKSKDYEICAVEQAENSVFLNNYTPSKKGVAVILGNEVMGVEQSTIDQSDVVLEIPQFGTKHSLNVSVCCGVVTWDLFQKLN